MRTLFIPFSLMATFILSGCSIQQTVTPAALSADSQPEICLIPAQGLRPGFNTAYEALLKEKGFQTRQLAPGSDPALCAVSTTYVGRWSWDFTIYMSYADIRVFQHGQQIGQAEYDARSGGLRIFSKFINAEQKIAELTDQLFPDANAGVLNARAPYAQRPAVN